MRRPLLAIATVSAFLLAGCSSGTSTGPTETRQISGSTGSTSQSASSAESPSSTPVPVDPLVGRWRSERTCQELVDALAEAGLGALTPWMLDEYVSATPDQLATRKNICQGAKPSVHYHFFTADGRFGSLDAQANQVDEGTYRITGPDTVDIPRGPPDFPSVVHVTFRFSITGGDTLTLAPVPAPSLKRKALADPSTFSAAGWAFGMTLGARHVWTRVPCAGWC